MLHRVLLIALVAALVGVALWDIMRRNPKELTVHFGGKVGAAIRQNYMDLQVEKSDGSMAPLLHRPLHFNSI